ncbi:MAG: hypothetical protein E6Q24_07105 [Chitinophagaceae bacterium]|nr:MAG: hypothetical protein E6Q24_07105 [Chitinophagaceae bacterium]
MIASPSEIAALESFFASITIPATLKLNPAIEITDLPTFVRSNIQKIKEGIMAEAVARPRYDDLLLIKEILTQQSATVQQ